MSAPHLFQCLTKPEFQACWAIRCTLGFESFDDAYPLADFASPGHSEEAETYEEQVRRAIRFLALDHGFAFEGLSVHEDGRIQGVPVEPRNIAYVQAIATGEMPNPLRACQVAVQVLEDRCPSVSTSPIRQLAQEIEEAIEAAPPPDPESWAEWERSKEAALNALGLSRESREMIH